MSDITITGAASRPVTTYAAPAAAEQKGTAATQPAEKTQKSRYDTVEISGKMQAVTKRATTIFGERIEQGDNESADEYHERVKTTLAKKCNEYYTKLFNGTLTEEERLPSTMELLQNRKPLVAKQMAGESDDAFMRRIISYDTSNAWHDHLLKTLTATTGMPMGEALRYQNEKGVEWVTDLMKNEPAMFRDWLESSVTSDVRNGWYDADGNFTVATVPKGFTVADYHEWMSKGVLDYLT